MTKPLITFHKLVTYYKLTGYERNGSWHVNWKLNSVKKVYIIKIKM